jgi:hypothetical protein
MTSINFWDITPYSPLSVNRRFPRAYRLHLQELFACWFLAEIISLTLKMEAICSSETSVDTRQTTRRYIRIVVKVLHFTSFATIRYNNEQFYHAFFICSLTSFNYRMFLLTKL